MQQERSISISSSESNISDVKLTFEDLISRNHIESQKKTIILNREKVIIPEPEECIFDFSDIEKEQKNKKENKNKSNKKNKSKFIRRNNSEENKYRNNFSKSPCRINVGEQIERGEFNLNYEAAQIYVEIARSFDKIKSDKILHLLKGCKYQMLYKSNINKHLDRLYNLNYKEHKIHLISLIYFLKTLLNRTIEVSKNNNNICKININKNN